VKRCRHCPFIATGQPCPQAEGDKMPLPEPNALLTRLAAAQSLTDAGYPISVATLTTKATRGGGPPFRKWGTRVLYNWGDALAWAENRVSAPRRSTSDTGAQQAAT
jgi:hypothetical protein